MNLPKLGTYELGEKLGEGAMGQIYSAYHQKSRINVAIKIPSSIKSDIDLKRFQREAEVMAKLRHPNIVKVYDVGIVNNTPFIAMELLDGVTLEKMILEGTINKKKAVDIAIKVAHALSYAHSQKIIHRDIKPENIMIINDTEPKIMDFGLAKFCNADVKLSTTGHVAGTIVYSSPEQASGKNNNVDHQSDIYSLGITFYKMLTGRVPYIGDSYMELLYQILKAEPILLTRIKKNMHPNLEAICLKAIAKDKKNRYENAIDFAYDLEMFQKGEAPKNVSVKRKIIGKNFSRKYFRQAILIVSLFLLCFFINKKWQEVTIREKAYLQLQQDHKVLINNKLVEHHKQENDYISLQQNYKNIENEFTKYKANQVLIAEKLKETQSKLMLYENPNSNISEQEHYVDLIIKKAPALILDDEEILYKIGKKITKKLDKNDFPLLDYIYSLAVEVALKKLNIKKNMTMQDFTERLSNDELELLRKFKIKKLIVLLKSQDNEDLEEYLQEPLEKIYFTLAKVNRTQNKEKACACYFNAYNIAAVKNAVVNANYLQIEKKGDHWEQRHRKKLYGDLNEKNLQEILKFYRKLEKKIKLEEIYLNTAKAIESYLNNYSEDKNDH